MQAILVLASDDIGSVNAMASEEEPQEIRLNVRLPEQLAGGVWANFARVNHSEHEFTIDFVRIDYASASVEEGTVDGIVVARVGVSPLFVTQLIGALQENWDKYARKALPREVYGDDEGDGPDRPAPERG
jgi:hypothetical protein